MSIKNWYNAIVNNDLHACNKVSTRDVAACINFIQIPDTETTIVTISVMKNKVKKNCLNPQNFARIMSCVENSLIDSLEDYRHEENTDAVDNEYFYNLKSELDNSWYARLCCHRIFFIPSKALWVTIKNLFKQRNILIMKQNGLSEVSVLTNTEEYDFNGRFY